MGYDSAGDEIVVIKSMPSGSDAEEIQGNIAAAATDSGNPVKVGGKVNSTLPTYTNGQRGDLQLGTRGQTIIAPWAGSAFADADAIGNTINNLLDSAGNNMNLLIRPKVFNGSTWDRMRGDTNGTLVEQRFTPSGVLTTDTAVKASAGFIHTVTFMCTDAAPTAGTIDIYNNTSATGTKVLTWSVTTTPFEPLTVTLDMIMSTGIYVDFTTTGDVGVSVSYR